MQPQSVHVVFSFVRFCSTVHSSDATCVCTSTTAGQCNQLAQSLVDLVPSLNTLFNATFTPATPSTAIWKVQGTSSGNCAAQADLVDVSPALNSATSPNRTTWAQAALLWNVVMTEDLDGASGLQDFVLNAGWTSLSPPDGRPTLVDPGSRHRQQHWYRMSRRARSSTAASNLVHFPAPPQTRPKHPTPIPGSTGR